MNTDDLINKLVQDAKPVKRLPSPIRRWISWTLMALLCVSAGIGLIGIRPGMADAPLSFWLESGILLILSLFSAAGAFILSVPGEARPWARLIPMSALMAWGIFLAFGILNDGNFSPDRGLACANSIFLLALLPGGLLIFMLRLAAPLKLEWSGGLALLAASAMAAFGMQFHCQSSDPLHLFLWHLLPVFVIGALGILIGKKLLKWAKF